MGRMGRMRRMVMGQGDYFVWDKETRGLWDSIPCLMKPHYALPPFPSPSPPHYALRTTHCPRSHPRSQRTTHYAPRTFLKTKCSAGIPAEH